MDQFTRYEKLEEYIPNIPPGTIISRNIFEDDFIKAILFGFAAGQELSEHTASKAAIIQVVSGEAQISLGAEVTEAGPGFWAHMRPKLPHGIKAKTELFLLLLLYKK